MQREARSRCVDSLRISGIARGGTAAEDTHQHVDRVNGAHTHAHRRCRQRISRTAARQVIGRQRRPAEHRIHEVRRIGADDEFLVGALLADLYVEPVLEQEFLLVPEFPQTRGAIALDAARGLNIVEIIGAEVSAMKIQRAYVEETAVPTERPLGVELQDRLGEAVVLGGVPKAARDIAKDFAGFLHRKGNAVPAEKRAKTEHIAEQEIAALEFAEEAVEIIRLAITRLVSTARRGNGRRSSPDGSRSCQCNTAPQCKPFSPHHSRNQPLRPCYCYTARL